MVTFAPGPIQQIQEPREQYGKTTSPTHGALLTRNYTQSDVRLWVLQWPSAPQSIKDAIDTAHDASLGGARTMDWTTPGGEDVRVRFKEGREGYRYDRQNGVEYGIVVQLEEAPEFRTPSLIP